MRGWAQFLPLRKSAASTQTGLEQKRAIFLSVIGSLGERPFQLIEYATKLGWWARQDSNLQPSGYEPLALTIELRARRRGTERIHASPYRDCIAPAGGGP